MIYCKKETVERSNNPDVVIKALTDKMHRVGYAAQDIEAFRNAWVAERSKHTTE